MLFFLNWVNLGSQIFNSHHYMHEFLLVVYIRTLGDFYTESESILGCVC